MFVTSFESRLQGQLGRYVNPYVGRSYLGQELASKATPEGIGKIVPQPELPRTQTFGMAEAKSLEFLADAGRKPCSVKFHTVRPMGGVVRCRFGRVYARPDPTGQSNEPARYRRLPAVVCRTIGARARTANREGLLHRGHWSERAI